MTGDGMANAESGGRLQRPSSSGAPLIASFRQVLTRHGLTMGVMLLGAALVLALGLGRPLDLEGFPRATGLYPGAAVAMALLAGIVWRARGMPLDARQWLWLVYLLGISVIEELAFRVFLPEVFNAAVDFKVAVVASNALFAGLHYVTLRWRFSNCVFVFFGGLALARLFHETGDLFLIIAMHWLATFLNTPAPPGRRRALSR